jgi:hypothetical protein
VYLWPDATCVHVRYQGKVISNSVGHRHGPTRRRGTARCPASVGDGARARSPASGSEPGSAVHPFSPMQTAVQSEDETDESEFPLAPEPASARRDARSKVLRLASWSIRLQIDCSGRRERLALILRHSLRAEALVE